MVELKESEFNHILKESEKLIYHLINKLSIRVPEKEFYQEGVIALWNAWKTYDESKGKFSTYAYFVIENRFIDLIRKANRRQEVEEAYKAIRKSDEISNVESQVLDSDPYLWKQIEGRLTNNQLTWVQLYLVEGLSIKEIAKMENVSVDAVKNWGRLAKAKLKVFLERQYISDRRR